MKLKLFLITLIGFTFNNLLPRSIYFKNCSSQPIFIKQNYQDKLNKFIKINLGKITKIDLECESLNISDVTIYTHEGSSKGLYQLTCDEIQAALKHSNKNVIFNIYLTINLDCSDTEVKDEEIEKYDIRSDL